MNTEIIREFCLKFPDATEKLQWGDDLCFKVAGKIFAMLGLDNPRMCIKCSPEIFADLVEREDIRPAPYVGRYKWVMLDRLDAVPWVELRELIGQSYEMVSAKAGKRSSSARSSSRTSGKRTLAKKKRSTEEKLRRKVSRKIGRK